MGASRARVARPPPRRGVRILGQLVRELGSGETARRAGVTVRTIQRWARGGVPAAARDDLREVVRRRELAKAAALARFEKGAKARAIRAARDKALARAKAVKDEARKKKLQEAQRRALEIRRREEARALEASRKKRKEELREKARRKVEAQAAAAKKAQKEAERKARLAKAEAQAAAAKKAREEKLRAAKEAQKEAERKARLAKVKAARDKALAEARKKARESRRHAAESEKLRRLEAAERKKREAQAEKEAAEKAAAQKTEKKLSETNEKARRILRLAEACRLFGDNNMGIAQIVGVDEATIRRWMVDPPLKSQAWDRLEMSLDEIHTLLELMKVAGEEDVLPITSIGSGVRSGKKTEGVYWTRLVKRRLNREVVKDIVQWVRKRPGKFFPLWQVVLLTSQFAVHPSVDFQDASPKKTDRDYKTIVLQIGHKKWGDFAVERWEPTPETSSRDAAARAITEVMNAKLTSDMVQVYVHSATVWAYRRRSDEEGIAWQGKQRKKREKVKSWKKKR